MNPAAPNGFVPAAPAVVVDRVTKEYTRRRPLRPRQEAPAPRTAALRDVSFTVHDGETIGILGPNGAGKTTLLKIIATLLHASAGRVLLHGRDVAKAPVQARRLLGLVTSDERSFYWRLTGRQNLRFFAALYGLRGSSLEGKVTELLAAVVLTEAADQPFHAYSSGMKQRLAIARGLLADPRIVLYDEPTRSLDPLTAHNIRRWILARRATSPHTAHVIATNQLQEAEQLCDRVVIVNHGRVIAHDTIAQIRRRWQQHDGIVHRVTVRGRAMDAGLRAAGVTVLTVDDEAAPDVRTLRFSAPDGSDALSLALAAILRGGGTILRCETEQVPFDEIFCDIVLQTSAGLPSGVAAELV